MITGNGQHNLNRDALLSGEHSRYKMKTLRGNVKCSRQKIFI